MTERPPVEHRQVRYWRDPRIEIGCVSNRTDLAQPAGVESPELRLLHALEDLGAVFPDPSAALEVIGLAFDASGDYRAAETLATIFARLPRSKEGAKLRQALLGTMGQGVTAAKKNGICKQSWFTSITRLHERLCNPPG